MIQSNKKTGVNDMYAKFTEDSRSVQEVAGASQSPMERVQGIEESMANLTFLAHEHITTIMILAFALFVLIAYLYIRN